MKVGEDCWAQKCKILCQRYTCINKSLGATGGQVEATTFWGTLQRHQTSLRHELPVLPSPDRHWTLRKDSRLRIQPWLSAKEQDLGIQPQVGNGMCMECPDDQTQRRPISTSSNFLCISLSSLCTLELRSLLPKFSFPPLPS